MSIISLIPARSGSKGISNKNLLEINGKSLIELAINVSLKTKLISETYISTDSLKYEKLAISLGAKSKGLRPKNLSNDNVRTVDTVLDFFKSFTTLPDILVLLQPTSPIRSPEDISKMLDILKENSDIDAVVSVENHEEPHPEKLKILDDNNIISSYIKGKSSEKPRQKLSKVYKLTGSIYVIKVRELMFQKTFLPKNTSGYLQRDTINIDKMEDYKYLKYLVETNKLNI